MAETTLQGGVIATQDSTLPVETLYYFDIVNTHSLSLNNQITDNWVENNTAVHDHIAQQPLTITLSGLRGEVVYSYNEQEAEEQLQEARTYALKYNQMAYTGLNFENKFLDNEAFKVVSDKLTTITSIIPSTSNITQLAKNVYDYANASFNRYKSAYEKLFNRTSAEEKQSLLSNIQEPDDTKLKELYRNFNAMRMQNMALTVSTPYEDFYGMYIQSLTLRQDNENYISDIELTLKQLRFANVDVTDPDPKVMGSYNAYAQAHPENNGTAQGEKKSIAAKLYDGEQVNFMGN